MGLSVCLTIFYGCSAPEISKKKYDVTGDRFDFIVLGDNRPDILKFEQFLRTIGALDVKYLVHVGDMIEFSSPLGFLSFNESLSRYLRSDIEFIPVVGNHDVEGSNGNTFANLELFNSVFDLPNNSLGYRRLDYPNFSFIVLNSFLPSEENEIASTQFSWLRTQLETIFNDTPSKSVFVFLHHPVFPAGAHPPLKNANELNRLLLQFNNVKAVFSGHEHLFYRHEETSGNHTIQYFVTGGAGSDLHTTERGRAVFHMMGVQVSPNFQITVMDVNGDDIVF